MSKKTLNPTFNDDNLEDDGPLRDSVDGNPDTGNLNFNVDEESFEYDVKGSDPDYDHPDPYNTAVKNGADMDSTYDEANPYSVDEYIPNESLETDVEQLGMHIDDGKIVEIDPIDDILSRTPEDNRSDLDEEGYPKNDRPNHP